MGHRFTRRDQRICYDLQQLLPRMDDSARLRIDSDWAILGGCALRNGNVQPDRGQRIRRVGFSAARGQHRDLFQLYDPPSPCQSGEAIYQEGYDIHDNVFRYLSNMMVITDGADDPRQSFRIPVQQLYDRWPALKRDQRGRRILPDPTRISTTTSSATHTSPKTFTYGRGYGIFFNNVLYDNMNYYRGRRADKLHRSWARLAPAERRRPTSTTTPLTIVRGDVRSTKSGD